MYSLSGSSSYSSDGRPVYSPSGISIYSPPPREARLDTLEVEAYPSAPLSIVVQSARLDGLPPRDSILAHAYSPEEEKGREEDDEEVKPSRWRQVCNFSFLLGLIQIGIVAAQIYYYGFAEFELNPMYGASPEVLSSSGAKNASRVIHLGEYWRLFTPMMLHAGVIHLAVNMMIQLRVGVYLESEFGLFPYILIYVLSGAFGTLMSIIFLPDQLGVGASGALMGLLGCWLIVVLIRWKTVPVEERGQRNYQLFNILLNIGATMALSLVSFVDSAAHIGGLCCGFVLGVIIFAGELGCKEFVYITRLVLIAIMILGFIASAAYAYYMTKPDRDLEDVCQYLVDNYDSGYDCDIESEGEVFNRAFGWI